MALNPIELLQADRVSSMSAIIRVCYWRIHLVQYADTHSQAQFHRRRCARPAGRRRSEEGLSRGSHSLGCGTKGARYPGGESNR